MDESSSGQDLGGQFVAFFEKSLSVLPMEELSHIYLSKPQEYPHHSLTINAML